MGSVLAMAGMYFSFYLWADLSERAVLDVIEECHVIATVT